MSWQGKKQQGQQFDREIGVIRRFERRVENYNGEEGQVPSIGNANTEVNPIDANASEVIEWLQEDIAAALAGVYHYTPAKLRLALPDILKSITVTVSGNKGNGEDINDGDVEASGTSPSASLSLSARASASASIMPDVQFVIESPWAVSVDILEWAFFLPDNFTKEDIATKLQELYLAEGAGVVVVNQWPKFKPISRTFTITGGQISVNATASIQQSVTISTANTSLGYGVGQGYSTEVGLTVKTVTLPPTLHGAFNFSDAMTDTPAGYTDLNSSVDKTFETSISASAAVSWPIQTNWPARTASSTQDRDLVARVSPAVVSATSPTDIPRGGLYLYDYKTRPYSDGHTQIFAQLVDMNYFS